MAESSAADFTVGKIQKDWGQRVAKMYGQQKRNIIHTSSTAYEQDHSAAAPPRSVMNSLSGRNRGVRALPSKADPRPGSLSTVTVAARHARKRDGKPKPGAAHALRVELDLYRYHGVII